MFRAKKDDNGLKITPTANRKKEKQLSALRRAEDCDTDMISNFQGAMQNLPLAPQGDIIMIFQACLLHNHP